MLSNSIPATAGFRLVAASPEMPDAPKGQHRYLPAAQPVVLSLPAKLTKSQIVTAIKAAIVELVHRNEPPRIKNSLHLSQQFGSDYAHLARVFSEATGVTIERYIIAQKIERVKMLLREELSIGQIAYLLHYSNIGHLCNQFKKVTGVTPSFFRQLMQQRDISQGYLSAETENDVIVFCNPVIVSLVRQSNFAR